MVGYYTHLGTCYVRGRVNGFPPVSSALHPFWVLVGPGSMGCRCLRRVDGGVAFREAAFVVWGRSSLSYFHTTMIYLYIRNFLIIVVHFGPQSGFRMGQGRDAH